MESDSEVTDTPVMRKRDKEFDLVGEPGFLKFALDK
jgi:hypothetical protein